MTPAKPFDVSRYRAFAQAAYYARRLGLDRLPGFERAVEALDRHLFPELRATSESLLVRIHGILLLLPRAFVSHYARGHFEPLTTRVFRGAIGDGSCVVDVGANIGYYAVLAGRLVGRSGRVHAIEPFDENLRGLRTNVTMNRLQNVVVHPVAAGATDEVREFHVTGSNDSHGFYDHPQTATHRKIFVRASRIDALIQESVGLYKIDVEGAEIEVLKGMRESMGRSPGAALIVEWNPACMRKANREPEEILEALKDLGVRDLRALDDRANVSREVDEVVRSIRMGDPIRHFNLFGHLPGAE
jgi:FkbM family methyltransferase